MKRFILFLNLIAGCLLPKENQAQTTYSYTFEYDASGNRISRTAVQLRSGKITSDSTSQYSFKAKEAEALKELLENKEIVVYPNPTKGLVTVEIALGEEDLGRISIFNIQGKTLFDLKNISTTTEIDFSGQPSGTYLMKIFLNGKTITWKIIKLD